MRKLLLVIVIAAVTLLNSTSSTEGFVNENKMVLNETNRVQTEQNEVQQSNLNTYTVQEGESVSDIAVEYGVPVEDLVTVNNLEGETVEDGEKLVIPETVSSEEKDLMARLVNAEAKGECYEGKVAVATVVLNRVDSPKFPDTITEVINAKNQFSPVSNGSINQKPSKEAIHAVNEAIALQEEGTDATFFYNPNATNDKWIKSLPVIEKIGNHNFATS